MLSIFMSKFLTLRSESRYEHFHLELRDRKIRSFGGSFIFSSSNWFYFSLREFNLDPVEKVGCCWELPRDVQLDSGNLCRVGRLGSSGHLQVLSFLLGEGLHRAFTKIFSTSALQLCRYPIMKSPSSLNFPQFDGCGMFQVSRLLATSSLSLSQHQHQASSARVLAQAH